MLRNAASKLMWGEKTTALMVGIALLAALVMVGLLAPQARAVSIFTVDRTSDALDFSPDDGLCDIDPSTTGEQCTLRAAIQQANADNNPSEVDQINFNIPSSSDPNCNATTKICTISPASTALPPITEPVFINGYSQLGASPNTKAVGDDASLKIQLVGSTNVANEFGFHIQDSPDSVIRGLVINRFTVGVFIVGTNAIGNRVEGNFLGTDPSGTLDEGNRFDGVEIFQDASDNVVGGATPAVRNVISGNDRDGVFLGSDTNLVQGNYIGTDKSGTKALGNKESGVNQTFVSRGMTIMGNVISGNDGSGLILNSGNGTRVLGNRIGTTASGTAALGNLLSGVLVTNFSFNNLIGDGTAAGSNTVAFNGQDGVEIRDSGTGNTVSRNSIFSNGGLGIDLLGTGEDDLSNIATANDQGDGDSGPNHLQNKPVISSAKTSSTATTIKGTLNSKPNQTFTIRFFSNPAGNEGKTFIGEKSVITDDSGNATFTKALAKVSVGKTVTATATKSGDDTSEFSAPRTVTSA